MGARRTIVLITCLTLAAACAGAALLCTRYLQHPQSSCEAALTQTTADPQTPSLRDAAADQAQVDAVTATPLIAAYGDVLIHCPVDTSALTELAFHQSDTPWALVLSTELPEADLEAAGDHRGTGRSTVQPNGDVYLAGSALHLWRTGVYTPMDTCIDCGALPGTPVVAPVTGTVMNVRPYLLEGTVEDYEVHIQPSGHPELDMVVIHATDICVAAGDPVTGGVTRIAAVRDIASTLTDIQLAEYTAEATGGNHTHIQLNDADYTGYREQRLSGAFVPTN